MNWPDLEPNPYLEFHAPGDVRIRGTRIDLCVIVEDYLDGRIPEQIVLEYPTLDLEVVYGTIAYYLGHEEAVMQYVQLIRERSDSLREQHSRPLPDNLVKRLRDHRSRVRAA